MLKNNVSPLYYSLTSLPTTQLMMKELQSNKVQRFFCVNATHCQSDERYTEFSRNHQCTFNALIFLAYRNEGCQFNTTQLDKVLEQGDALYCWIKANLLQEGRYKHDHLTLEKLTNKFILTQMSTV